MIQLIIYTKSYLISKIQNFNGHWDVFCVCLTKPYDTLSRVKLFNKHISQNKHSATKYTIHIIIELYNEIKAEAVVIY